MTTYTAVVRNDYIDWAGDLNLGLDELVKGSWFVRVLVYKEKIYA